MPSYLYKPGHPLANVKGFVERNDYYEHLYLTEPDMRAVIGNRVVIAPYYIPDEMAPMRHMARPSMDVTRDGRTINHMYTSKKKFRDETRARGCVEIGTESLAGKRKHVELDRRQRRDDIKRAIWECKNGDSRALYELRNGVKSDSE